MKNFLAIFLGGGLGALLRYSMSAYCASNFTYTIPLGTLLVNLLGGLLIGLLLPLLTATTSVAVGWKLFLVTGFLGGLTTFSTFSYDTIGLLENSLLVAMANIMANLVGSLGMTMLGIYISQKFI